MQNEPEGKGTYRSLLWKVLEGDRGKGKLGEETRSMQKYLVTTRGK
jgi:hypothetical protein